MKKLVLVSFFVILLAAPAFAQRGEFAEPVGADLVKFPIRLTALSLSEQADFGLSAKRLETPVIVQNYFRSLRDSKGRFVLETLPVGTLVLVSQDGKIRYKADCGNRLVEVPVCPPIATPTGMSNSPAPSVPSAWSRFWNALAEAWGAMWGLFGSLLGVLIPLFLLALLCWLGYLLFRAIQNRQQGGGRPPRPIPPQPPIPPRPPVPPQPPIPPEPVLPAFPARRVIIDFGDRVNATRVQAGRDIIRVQFDRNPDGSAVVRIQERRN